MARPSAFKSEEARSAYFRLYDEVIRLSEVAVEESDIETSFGTTHVLTAGDPSKPPLVALHALSTSSTLWLPLLPALTASHHVRMLDTVGDVGKSVPTGVLSSSARVVDWIDETLDRLGVERGAFVAASLGTWMATQYATARPFRVERLALIGPAGIVSPQHLSWMWRAIIDVRVRGTPQAIEAFLDSHGPERTRQLMRVDPWRPIMQQLITGLATFRRSLREPRPVHCNVGRLADSGVPILVVIGRDETLHDGTKWAQRFRQRLPGAQVRLVDDAGHFIFIDQQEVVADQLRAFLGQ